MFRSDLKARLEKIFIFGKTTFDEPGDSLEQDTLFVTVTRSSSKTHKGWATAKVEGYLTVFSRGDALPYGYFSKRIEQADPLLTNPFFFYEMETDIASSPARMIDIHERRLSFIFLYEEQYDPRQGELTSLELIK